MPVEPDDDGDEASRGPRQVYSTLLRLVVPAYLGKLWWRGRVEPLYRHAIAERFGFYRSPASSGWLWLHAVSLGETRAAAALIVQLRQAVPGLRLLLTHGTATGLEAGRDLVGPGDLQTWLPFDTPGSVRRFLAHFRPAVGVLMETEIWPNLLVEAGRRRLPMVLANARLSERSLRRGQRFAAVLRPAFSRLTIALAQTEDDATRLRSAGAREVVVSGNLKFDMTADAALLARGRAWRARVDRPVVMAAATREGEEAMLIAAWQSQARSAVAGSSASKPLLLIVPRHPQRFDDVAGLLRSADFTVVRRSDWAGDPPVAASSADVWLGDSMREMPLYYALADVALLGGSFAPFGGQNLIEAAACGCPLIMGPSTFNFDQAARFAEAAGAALRTETVDHAVTLALGLIGDPARAGRMRGSAVAFARKHRGAAASMAGAIAELMASASNHETPVAG